MRNRVGGAKGAFFFRHCWQVAGLLTLWILSLATAAASTAAIAPAASAALAKPLSQPPQPATGQVGSSAVHEAASLSPERLQLRLALMQQGEAALARLEVGPAMEAFDRAALILHSADTEMALVRTYMQGGEYRRALAFGAHTAGAHLDEVGSVALYAWLLHLGGQGAIAQKLLTEALARTPGQPLVTAVQQQLQSGRPMASGGLLALPARLAPYAESQGLPAKARVIGTGLLLADGRQVLVPLALLAKSNRPLWLRNGLGQLRQAGPGQRLPALGLAVLQLKNPLPLPETLWAAPTDPFPGSVGYAASFVLPAKQALPAWPLLRLGFMGPVLKNEKRQLAIDLPTGPLGGPVFDASGRLSGVAMAADKSRSDTSPEMVPASQLRAALGKAWPPSPPAGTDARLAMDSMYESSLRLALQVIAAP